MDNSDSNSVRPTVSGAPSNHSGGNLLHHSKKKTTKDNKEHVHKWIKLAVISLVSLVIVWGGILLGEWVLFSHNSNATGGTSINSSQYQAVFLTNGQVYFGKITTVNPYIVSIKDIYYLQVQQSVQPSTSSSSQATASSVNNSSGSGQVQLVKLGNEIHGPVDVMTINRSQVLFWENLKSDSKVSQAITNYQK